MFITIMPVLLLLNQLLLGSLRVFVIHLRALSLRLLNLLFEVLDLQFQSTNVVLADPSACRRPSLFNEQLVRCYFWRCHATAVRLRACRSTPRSRIHR